MTCFLARTKGVYCCRQCAATRDLFFAIGQHERGGTRIFTMQSLQCINTERIATF